MKSISNFCFISLFFDSFQEERGRKFFYPDNNKFNRSAFSSAKIQRIAEKMRFNFVLLKFDVVDFSSCPNHTRNGKSIIVMYMFHMDICCTACPNPQTLWINLLAFKFFLAFQFIPLIPCVCVCFFPLLLLFMNIVHSDFILLSSAPCSSEISSKKRTNVVNRSSIFCVPILRTIPVMVWCFSIYSVCKSNNAARNRSIYAIVAMSSFLSTLTDFLPLSYFLLLVFSSSAPFNNNKKMNTFFY